MTPEENQRITKLEDKCNRLKTLIEGVIPCFITALSAMAEDNVGRRNTMNRFIRFALPRLNCDEDLKQQFLDDITQQDRVLELLEMLFNRMKKDLPPLPILPGK